MEVNGTGSVQGGSPLKQVQPTTEPVDGVQATDQSTSISPQDEVEISPAARMMEALNQSPEFRAERLAQIKAEIDAGTFETPEKLEIALERLLHEIQVDE